ncbi:MAG: 5'-nucleotidase [Gammaproteobacteria bacterium]|nr:5'-nucleotidase [Gammaproteobacteria bacterium]
MSSAAQKSPHQPLVIAISSRALFDLDESHRVFEQQGLEAFERYQREHENELLQPGMAFDLVHKLLALNDAESGYTPIAEHPGVEVVLMSRNSADTGLRVFNAIEHYGLGVIRAAFTNGASPHVYMEPFGAQLFLSAHEEDVRAALDAGHAAATLIAAPPGRRASQQLRLAFDGDAVLFSDDSEQIYQRDGLDAFVEAERAAAEQPMLAGPFKPVLQAIHQIQSAYPMDHNPIRTALVTARSAPAHKRVILTLRDWGIRIDESMFLGGRKKGQFLRAFGADIYFDDQMVHVESTGEHVATGHVPHGVTNTRSKTE